MTAREIAEAQTADPGAYQFFHFVSELVKHPANLPVDALAQHDADPRRLDEKTFSISLFARRVIPFANFRPRRLPRLERYSYSFSSCSGGSSAAPARLHLSGRSAPRLASSRPMLERVRPIFSGETTMVVSRMGSPRLKQNPPACAYMSPRRHAQRHRFYLIASASSHESVQPGVDRDPSRLNHPRSAAASRSHLQRKRLRRTLGL